MSRRIAMTGASGFIGGALEPALAPGARLQGLFRTSSVASERWRERGHEVVFGDLHDEEALDRLVEGADVVYHLAARGAKDDPAASRRVNVDGTERLARAIHRGGKGRLVFVSSISVYAATTPADGVITEETRPENVDLLNPYSATKYEAERVLRDLAARGEGPEHVVVRPTNVYGPGGRAWVTDWIERVQRLPVVIGGDVPADMVHVDDVARGLVGAGRSEAAAGETLHMGHHTLPLGEYVARLGRRVLDRRVRRLPGPVDAVARQLIEGGHRLLHGHRRSFPLTRHARFPHDRARRLAGYDPTVSLDEGLDDVRRWYRSAEGPGG